MAREMVSMNRMTNLNIIRLLKNQGYKWPPKEPYKGLELEYLMLISLGREKLHDSGYPFIQVYGVDKDKNLYDLGIHDHVWFYKLREVNVDSIGANIFRMWTNKRIKVKSTHFVSSLKVDENNEVS